MVSLGPLVTLLALFLWDSSPTSYPFSLQWYGVGLGGILSRITLAPFWLHGELLFLQLVLPFFSH